MKSLLISSTYFPPQVGGISHFMGAISSVLGPDRVCCLTGVQADNGAERKDCEPRIYRRPAAFAKTNFLQAVGCGAAISQIMIRERPKAVQLATVGEGYLGLQLQQWLRLPFVVYAHGNDILAALDSSWDKPKLALQRAGRVLANSRFTAELVQRAGVNPERISIVHPGCDVEHFRPLAPDPVFKRRLLGDRAGDRVIVTVGGLVPRKGYDMVIRALPHLLRRCPDVTYLIVTSSYRDNNGKLESMARDVGVGDRVVFAYDVPNADLPRVYALSEIFIMPSRAHMEANDVEGFGLVYLEANACGKAVVGGRSGGIPDAVVEGVTGLLVDPQDPEAIATALVELLSNSELTTRLGRQGRARVIAEFTWNRVANKVQDILETL
jgi:phosphatidylinositol alpha-1,6-mannosyltransferase